MRPIFFGSFNLQVYIYCKLYIALKYCRCHLNYYSIVMVNLKEQIFCSRNFLVKELVYLLFIWRAVMENYYTRTCSFLVHLFQVYICT
ncbi:hypothetical protein Lalb_Chr16g0389661 [Lupinus albus]|uniref:Uncharacterized protein n=1 Tax=Lupinus albus TaxID=3870 RepID=A0A6A4P4T5_LUPAL|nr:hypothetical protein Lalb_Chr16g0389661 [Lupinus albus]